MAISASKLRENIYKILDQVLKTGEPVEIQRGGRTLKIVPAGDADVPKLQRLISRPDAILTGPQEIVHIDWSEEWRP